MPGRDAEPRRGRLGHRERIAVVEAQRHRGLQPAWREPRVQLGERRVAFLLQQLADDAVPVYFGIDVDRAGGERLLEDAGVAEPLAVLGRDAGLLQRLRDDLAEDVRLGEALRADGDGAGGTGGEPEKKDGARPEEGAHRRDCRRVHRSGDGRNRSDRASPTCRLYRQLTAMGSSGRSRRCEAGQAGRHRRTDPSAVTRRLADPRRRRVGDERGNGRFAAGDDAVCAELLPRGLGATPSESNTCPSTCTHMVRSYASRARACTAASTAAPCWSRRSTLCACRGGPTPCSCRASQPPDQAHLRLPVAQPAGLRVHRKARRRPLCARSPRAPVPHRRRWPITRALEQTERFWDGESSIGIGAVAIGGIDLGRVPAPAYVAALVGDRGAAIRWPPPRRR